jgi:hypothetical protein
MRSLRVVLLVLAASAWLLSGCGQGLTLSHSETTCINPGQVVTLKTEAPEGTELTYKIEDDFGAAVAPAIPPVKTDGSGKATVTWQSPSSLSTTAVHFNLTAKKGSETATRDIHVEVGGSGRSC